MSADISSAQRRQHIYYSSLVWWTDSRWHIARKAYIICFAPYMPSTVCVSVRPSVHHTSVSVKQVEVRIVQFPPYRPHPPSFWA